ncbi:MAG: hypothetical protein PHT46_03280 [Candidatus Marinimicrobia bacterium]|jgi:hypothetical protein|nr:hypothetical protein [Candidatus Neomarinimicrobiota bacterium]MDD5710409.1 hypothetical protein [Candidatus Neomarinimicrobiota bacterium]MDX9777530.1 hypothetical protein [bacterium]
MKTLKLSFRQFLFREDNLPGLGLKDVQILIREPGKPVTLRATPPLIATSLQIDMEFRSFENGVLAFEVKSGRGPLQMLKMAAPDIIELDYPQLRMDTETLSRKYLPGFRIRNMHVRGGEYLLELELV